jgi:hypothetical protein
MVSGESADYGCGRSAPLKPRSLAPLGDMSSPRGRTHVEHVANPPCVLPDSPDASGNLNLAFPVDFGDLRMCRFRAKWEGSCHAPNN